MMKISGHSGTLFCMSAPVQQGLPAGEPVNGKSPGDIDKGVRPDSPAETRPREIGGPPGPEPTRYGDWEKRGRCIDF